MRILLVVDGSSYSDTATRTLEALKLPTETEVTVMTVVPEHTFLGGISLDMLRGTASAEKKAEEEKAVKLLSGPVELLSAGGLKVEGLVRRGNPAEVILKVAEQKSYSLVVMGTKGLTDPLPFRLGSVAQSVARHATASVLLARPKTLTLHRVSPSRDKSLSIDRVLFATDGSQYSGAAAQFLLDLPLPRSTQVMVLTALQSHTASLLKVPTLDFETNRQLLADLQAAEEKEARKLLDRARQGFQDHGYKTG
jgi:nucleotide-binding universal stress UspA family protein